MTFAAGLRALLRQDPDIIMVGEIRDKETASIAIQASLTGHLVFSTLHTNSAVGAITRLMDMDIQSYLVASSLIGTISQRLLRVLCSNCKEKYFPDETEIKIIGGKENIEIYKPKGCKQCNDFGYKGRMSIYEVNIVDEKFKEMIHNEANEQNLEEYARKKTLSLFDDGIQRVISGDTSLEEVLRVTNTNESNKEKS